MPDLPPFQPPQQSEEDRIRSALEDTIAVVKKLGPLCKDVQDLVDLCELGLLNDAQLRLIMDRLAPVQLRK